MEWGARVERVGKGARQKGKGGWDPHKKRDFGVTSGRPPTPGMLMEC